MYCQGCTMKCSVWLNIHLLPTVLHQEDQSLLFLHRCLEDLQLHFIFPLALFLSLEHWHLSPIFSSCLCVHLSKCLIFQLLFLNTICCSRSLSSPSFTSVSMSVCLLFWVLKFRSNMTLYLVQFFPIILKFYLVVSVWGACSISSKRFWRKPSIIWEQKRNLN